MRDITELVVIPKESALQIFTTEGAIDQYLNIIRDEIDKFVPDTSTISGRERIASFSYKISKCKTGIDAIRKDLADEQKEIPKKIDATGKRVRDTLDQWRDEVRKPLTDWEEAESARQNRIKSDIDELQAVADDRQPRAAQVLKDRLAEVFRMEITEAVYNEYLSMAREAWLAACDHLGIAIQEAEQREKDALELAELRKADDARKAKEAMEAAAKAKAEREAKIAQEASAEATRKAQAEIEAGIKREADQKRQIDEANTRAEMAAKDAKEKFERDQDAKLKADLEEVAKREANKKHKAKINRGALDALIKGAGLNEAQAQAVVELIAKKMVPNVTINY